VTSVPEPALVRAAPPRARARGKPRALPQGFEQLRARLTSSHHADASRAVPTPAGGQIPSVTERALLVPPTTTLTRPLPEAERSPATESAVSHAEDSRPVEEQPALASVPTTTLTRPLPEAERSPATESAVSHAEDSRPVEEQPALASVPARPVPPALQLGSPERSGTSEGSDPERALPGTGHRFAVQASAPRALARERGGVPAPTPGATPPAHTPSPATETVQLQTAQGGAPASPSVVVVALPHASVPVHQGSVAEMTAGASLPTGVSDPPASIPLSFLPSAVMQVVRQGTLPRTVTLHLEPKELGEVQLQVQSVGTDIHVQIGARNPETRMLVGSLLEDLAQQLRRDLGSGGQQHREQPGRRLGPLAAPSSPSRDVESSVEPATSGLVDLRL